MQELSARLHYLELGSERPDKLASWYKDAMGMQICESGRSYRCSGSDRIIVISPGQSRAILSAGYAVRDKLQLDELALRLRESESQLFPDETFFETGFAVRDPVGNKICFGLALPGFQWTSALPGRLQHLVLATRSADRLVAFYVDVVGFRESDRVLDERGSLRTCFLRSDHEHHSLAFFQASEDRLDHHCYEAGEWNLIRDWGDHFASLDIPVAWGPGRHGPGNNLFIFVHDLDGNWLEISAELENVRSDHQPGIWPHSERTLNKWGSAPLRT